MVATSHVQLLNTWNVSSMTEKLIFRFHLILINSRMWLVATIVDSAALERWNRSSWCWQLQSLLVLCISLRNRLRGKTWLVLVLLEYFSCYRTQLDLSPKFSKVVFSMERVHFGVWKNCGFLFNDHIGHLCSDCIRLNLSMNQVFLQVYLFSLQELWESTRC